MIISETGAGLADAESYISVTDATATITTFKISAQQAIAKRVQEASAYVAREILD